MVTYVQTGRNEIETTIKALERARPCLSDHVLIKPNITSVNGSRIEMYTSPRVVEGIINYLRSKGVSDIIMGDGAGETWNAEHFARTGYTELSERLDVPLINLDQENLVSLKVLDGHCLDKVDVAQSLADRYIVSVPKLKTHRLTGVTAALKNLMGAILPYNKKDIMHPKYDEALRSARQRPEGVLLEHEFREAQSDFFRRISDYYSALHSVGKPELSVIDGINARDGDAFTLGRDIPLNCIITSDDVVEADYVASHLMKMEPGKLYFPFVKGKNFGSIDDVDVRLDKDLEGLRKTFVPIFLTETIAQSSRS